MRFPFREVFEQEVPGTFRPRRDLVLNGVLLRSQERLPQEEPVAGIRLADLSGCDLEGYDENGRLLIYGYYRI